MYKASSGFIEAQNQLSRTFCAKIEISGGGIITSGIKQIKWSFSSMAEETLTIGGAVAGFVEISMYPQSISLENKEITVYIGLTVDGAVEYVPLGLFTVTSQEDSGDLVRVTAYDRMICKTEKPFFSELSYPASTINVLREICNQIGVVLDVTNLSVLTMETKPEGYTYREVISYIAGLYGRFANFDRTGTLVFNWFSSTSTALSSGRIAEPTWSAEETYKLTKIECAIDDETILVSGSGATCMQISNPFMTQDILDGIFSVRSGYSYRGGVIDMLLGNILLDPWDSVSYDGYQVPCMLLEHTFDGGLRTKVTAYQESQADAEISYQGPTVQRLDRYFTDLLLVQEVLAHKVDTDYLNANFATINQLNATNATVEQLDAKKLNADEAELLYANIDFANIGEAAIRKIYADTGLIKDLVVGDQSITGELVGVTIRGDMIIANTIMADKLVIRGEDGLYYKLNTDGATVESEQTDYNSLNGSVIIAKSITASKIAVDDLVAFDATIGGFQITSSAIYSGTKNSPLNTTRGIYMDRDGQFSVGDSDNYIRYYKTDEGKHKLEISAVDNVVVGGENLIHNAKTMIYDDYTWEIIVLTDESGIILQDFDSVTLVV